MRTHYGLCPRCPAALPDSLAANFCGGCGLAIRTDAHRRAARAVRFRWLRAPRRLLATMHSRPSTSPSTTEQEDLVATT